MDKKEKIELMKNILQLISTGLVDFFTGAVLATTISNMSGSKLSKIGLGLGGGLVGIMIGDKVGEYVYDSVGDMMQTMEDLKDIIEGE